MLDLIMNDLMNELRFHQISSYTYFVILRHACLKNHMNARIKLVYLGIYRRSLVYLFLYSHGAVVSATPMLSISTGEVTRVSELTAGKSLCIHI